MRFRIVYSAVARPQGRGKIERLFGTITTELLPELPGHVVEGRPASPPTAVARAARSRRSAASSPKPITQRVHGETGQGTTRRLAMRVGFLPRLPESLEELDLLLVMHAKPRQVRRDGVRFQGLRYVAPTLAAFVGEAVTIRYDPRDLSEIRVFHRDRFLCRAVSEEHAGEAVTLKDIEAARRARRRALRAGINERVARVADLLPAVPTPLPARSG